MLTHDTNTRVHADPEWQTRTWIVIWFSDITVRKNTCTLMHLLNSFYSELKMFLYIYCTVNYNDWFLYVSVV